MGRGGGSCFVQVGIFEMFECCEREIFDHSDVIFWEVWYWCLRGLGGLNGLHLPIFQPWILDLQRSTLTTLECLNGSFECLKQEELERRKRQKQYTGAFSAVCSFLGYQVRFESEFEFEFSLTLSLNRICRVAYKHLGKDLNPLNSVSIWLWIWIWIGSRMRGICRVTYQHMAHISTIETCVRRRVLFLGLPVRFESEFEFWVDFKCAYAWDVYIESRMQTFSIYRL